MTILRIDPNERRYHNLLEIIKIGEEIPNYYEVLFDNARNLFYGLNRPDLVKEFDELISSRLEKKMGRRIDIILHTYKNLPYLNSYTRHPLNADVEFRKYDIRFILRGISHWVMMRMQEVEPMIRFTLLPKQNI